MTAGKTVPPPHRGKRKPHEGRLCARGDERPRGQDTSKTTSSVKWHSKRRRGRVTTSVGRQQFGHPLHLPPSTFLLHFWGTLTTVQTGRLTQPLPRSSFLALIRGQEPVHLQPNSSAVNRIADELSFDHCLTCDRRTGNSTLAFNSRSELGGGLTLLQRSKPIIVCLVHCQYSPSVLQQCHGTSELRATVKGQDCIGFTMFNL